MAMLNNQMVIIASYDILIGSPLQILFQFQLSCPEAHQFPSAIRRSHSDIRCLGASPEVTLRYWKMAGWKIPNRWRFQWECHLKIPMCVNGWFSIPTFDYRTQLGTMKINKIKKVVRCGLICLYPFRFSTACDGTAKSPFFSRSTHLVGWRMTFFAPSWPLSVLDLVTWATVVAVAA